MGVQAVTVTVTGTVAAATAAAAGAAAVVYMDMAGGIGSRRGRRERERRHGREMGHGRTPDVAVGCGRLALLLLEMPFCGGRRGPGIRRGAAGDDGQAAAVGVAGGGRGRERREGSV